MNEMKGEKVKNMRNKGITLIALVITIIVLLILAGVTIATLTGENGILTRAQEAKTQTEEAEDIEKIRLAMSEAQIGESGYQELDKINFEKALNSQFEGKGILLADNTDGTYTITLDEKVYTIENNAVTELQVDLYINNVEDLKRFRDDVNNGNTYEGKYIMLTSDISLNENEYWTPIGVYSKDASTPDDEINKPFKGNFNGGGHVISNLNIYTEDKCRGFFSLVIDGQISNLSVENTSTNVDFGATGGAIANYVINSNIVNCINRIDMTAQWIIGGIASQIYSSSIIGCSNYGEIKSTENAACGGIVGSTNSNSTIINCSNYGSINSNSKATGGISGLVNNSNVQNSFNLASITNTKDNTGGITGQTHDAHIYDCYNTGEIISEGDYIGGIVGYKTEAKAYIKNCYNVGSINGANSLHIGGILGYNNTGNADVTNNYYLEGCVNSSNENTMSGVETKTAEQMKKLSSLLGSAFKEDTNNINDGYPILKWQ